ncbi:MAG: FKBP-type peptidyl-prolyl cis-trans isomerase [Edaphocola sp.]
MTRKSIGLLALLAVSSVGVMAQTKKHTAAKKTTTAGQKTTQHNGTSYKAVPQGAYIPVEGGLEYKLIKKGTGTFTPAIGDGISFHISQRINDSLLMSSAAQNGGKPVEFVLQESKMKGDLTVGIMKLHAGDSAVFRIKLDTIAARTQQPVPAWAKPGSYLYFDVGLVGIKSKAELEAERKLAQEQAEAMAKVQRATDDSLIQDYLKSKGIANAQKTASGLYYTIHEPGAGENAKVGQKVTVNYTGQLVNGEKFDSNVDSAFGHVQPFTFDLGKHSVIQGWDEGVALLNKGAKATLYIPSALGYGPRAAGPKIPANSVLVFDIELVEMQ